MTNRFLDRTNKTGDLADTWHWTNASTNVHAVAAGGNATTCCVGGTPLVAGDYICPQTDTEWYKIASVTDANTIVLAYAYRGTTRDGDTTNFADVSVNDGTTIAKAFVHLMQYTSTEVRAAGDVLYCRRGQTHTHKAISITTDEAGTIASYIVVIADDGTNWAGEGGLTDPIFDGADDTTYTWILGSYYWRFEELKFYRIDNSNGVQFAGAGNRIINCTIDDCDGTYGILNGGAIAYYNGCTFKNCSGTGLCCTNDASLIIACIFDSNGKGLRIGATSSKIIENIFTNNTTDVELLSNSQGLIFIGCSLDLTKINFISSINKRNNLITVTFQDCGINNKNQNRSYSGLGYFSKETAGFIHAGGADTSIKAIGYSALDDYADTPFIIYETWIYSDGASHTYTVYVLADGTWAAIPTSAQLWLEANYFDQAGDAGRANVKSNDAIAAEETWTPLDVTCDPAAAGMVQLRICLSKYEASKEIWVDPLIVVT